MKAAGGLQVWMSQLQSRQYALAVGFGVGVAGAGLGLLIAVMGPWLALAAILGVLAGLYVITDVEAALYGVIGVVLLLPFGVLPVKIAITPTLLDLALGGFLLAYIFRFMERRGASLRLRPVHAMVAGYVMWLVLAFALGMRHASPSSANIRQFAEALLSIGLVFIVCDLARSPAMLRRLTRVVILTIGAQALLAIALYIAADSTAEALLVRLSRIGYPAGGVIRYIEDNPALAERAIGTWVDPNALGGVLAAAAALMAPQLFARKPLFGGRWLTLGLFAAVALALLLTSSRASFLALGAGLTALGLLRYRRLLPALLAGGLLFLVLPQTQAYIARLVQAFQGEDLATQMRVGEWTDSLELISRHPLVGVGFTGTPEIDIYANVANMYLMMAAQIGLIGVVIFLLTMAGVFMFARRAWRVVGANPTLSAIHLGFHAALFTALVNAVADLYFFRLDFQASITWFWMIVALCVASTALIVDQAELDGAKLGQTRAPKKALLH